MPFMFADLEYPTRPAPSEAMFQSEEYAGMSADAMRIVLDREWVEFFKEGKKFKGEKIMSIGKIFQTISTESQNALVTHERWEEKDHDPLEATKILMTTHTTRTTHL